MHGITPRESDANLRQRLLSARTCSGVQATIPTPLVPVVKKLIQQGHSKKSVCLLFGIDYAQLKVQLRRLNVSDQ